jgi:hypothetical protein
MARGGPSRGRDTLRVESEPRGGMAGITHRSFVSYIDRTRDYYAAQGYVKPYAWARHTDAPFARLPKPLAQCRVAVITTASPWRDARPVDGVLRGGKQVWSGDAAAPPEHLYTDDLAWDKQATHTRDVDSFVPLRRLAECAAAGRIGSLAPRFHGVPTDYSQRRTTEHDAPEILRRCREDDVDAALLVPL